MSLSSSSLVLWLGVALLHAQPAPRLWTPQGGTPIEAALVSADEGSVQLRAADGRRFALPLADLAPEDRAVVDDWLFDRPVKLPDAVGVPSGAIDVALVSEDEAAGVYVYQTPNFEFTVEGKLTQNLLRDVARNFEATRLLVQALPWSIDPKPESGPRFKALLLRNRSRYEDMGGPPNSGGVYFGARGVFLVPFESLGIRQVGKSFAKDDTYRSDTLVHELVHQMMHASLPLLPQWVIEGTAEYANVLPLRLGTFRLASAKAGLREHLDQLARSGGVPDPVPLEELFATSHRDWGETLRQDPEQARRLYFTSYLAVYYFMHLDGAGDALRFRRYLRSVEQRRSSGQTTEEPIDLLLDGRRPEDLNAEIRTAYRKLGIRL